MQVPQAAASVESIRHWNEATPEPPVSVPENEKLAAALFVSAGGLDPIEVSGAVVSTVQVELAALWSTLPAWSIARTSNLWLPSVRDE